MEARLVMLRRLHRLPRLHQPARRLAAFSYVGAAILEFREMPMCISGWICASAHKNVDLWMLPKRVHTSYTPRTVRYTYTKPPLGVRGVYRKFLVAVIRQLRLSILD